MDAIAHVQERTLLYSNAPPRTLHFCIQSILSLFRLFTLEVFSTFQRRFHTEKLERCVFLGERITSRKWQRPCWRATLGHTAFSSRNSVVSFRSLVTSTLGNERSSLSLSQLCLWPCFCYSHVELKEKVNLLLQINEKLALQLNE